MAILLTESTLNCILENNMMAQLNDFDYLEEAYYGEKPVQEAFWAFSNFRDKYIGKSVLSITAAATDKDIIKFNRAMESAFGFYRFSLDIDGSTLLNAFTFPIGGRRKAGSAKEHIGISKSGNGVRFDTSSKMVAITIITWGLLSDANITNREAFAVILHEVGHNFSSALLEGGA